MSGKSMVEILLGPPESWELSRFKAKNLVDNICTYGCHRGRRFAAASVQSWVSAAVKFSGILTVQMVRNEGPIFR
jgi:hypothetical protein